MTTTVRPDEKTTSLQDRRAQYLPRGLASTTPIIVDRAHGSEVWDVDGRHYIDFAGGISTLNVGHTPEGVTKAIAAQAERLIHMAMPVAAYEPYIALAERLANLLPSGRPAKTLLLNSGAEAVENAVKIARVATGRTGIIAFENGFHGRTNLAMALTGKERPYKAGFGPFTPDVFHARFPYRYRCVCGGDHDGCSIENGQDLERLFATTIAADQVAAIIVEPVQGEGGFVVAPAEWLRTLRAICDREGILLIADEVQTGFGRTGRMLAVEHSGVQADLIVLAKSIAAGLPLSAVVGRAEIMDAPNPGSIGGTFGGNPVACAAALAVLDMFDEDDLVARGARIGAIIANRFAGMAERYRIVGEARGLGAMQALELVTDRATKQPARQETAAILRRCLDDGLIVLKAGLYDNVIRVLTPLTIEENLLNRGLDILERALAEEDRQLTAG